MRVLTSCLLVGLALPAFAAEQAYAVQVGEAATLSGAKKSATALAQRLSLAERSSVGQPPAVPVAGTGVQIYRAQKGYRLVAYVGREGQAQIALEAIRREVHSATLTTHDVEAGALDLAPDSDLVPAYVLVAGRDRSHPGAVEQARAASKRLAIPWDSRGLIWDSADGLVFPRATKEVDDPYSSLFAGAYFLRRSNGCDAVGQLCVSVERADAYDGEKGELWVVAGMAFDATEAGERLASLRALMPEISAQPTWVWMGCPF